MSLIVIGRTRWRHPDSFVSVSRDDLRSYGKVFKDRAARDRPPWGLRRWKIRDHLYRSRWTKTSPNCRSAAAESRSPRGPPGERDRTAALQQYGDVFVH